MEAARLQQQRQHQQCRAHGGYGSGCRAAAPAATSAKLGAQAHGGGVGRRTLAFWHFVVLGFLFFPPLVLCVSLGTDADVVHFAGTKGLWALLVVPFLLVAPVAHLCGRPGSTALVASALLPAILLAYVGASLRDTAGAAKTALYDRDCTAFDAKQDLYETQRKLEHMLSTCGAVAPSSVRECPWFSDFFKEHREQVQYLESLEYRFDCAGICRHSPRLFFNAGVNAPSCGLFVAQWMRSARIQASIVMWYGLGLIALSFASRLLLKPLLQ